eukprot:scaffold625_cov420-Prasinococcus_capsulatus_cf.AAC.10
MNAIAGLHSSPVDPYLLGGAGLTELQLTRADSGVARRWCKLSPLVVCWSSAATTLALRTSPTCKQPRAPHRCKTPQARARSKTERKCSLMRARNSTIARSPPLPLLGRQGA